MATPEAEWARSTEAELADLERVWNALDVPGHRVELIDGQLVVSPSVSRSHSATVYRLVKEFIEITERRGWLIHTNLTVHVARTRERLIPDLMIAAKDAPGYGENELLASGVLLVVEVVSPSSQRQDRVAKPRAYAQGQVPLYLIVDQITSPRAVMLFSDPADNEYQRCERAFADMTLRLPEPFGIALDVGKLIG